MSDCVTNEREQDRFEALVYSWQNIINHGMEPFLSEYISNLETKIEEMYQKDKPYTPFDLSNLIAQGADRLDCARSLIETFSNARSFCSSNSGDEHIPELSAVRDATINLIEKLIQILKTSPTDYLFANFLNENTMCEKNLNLFRDCQKIIFDILSYIVQSTLEYQESIGTIFSVSNSLNLQTFLSETEPQVNQSISEEMDLH